MTKRSTILITASLVTLLVLFAPVARADIYEWEYINPANPSEGKQQSTTLTPNGAGANAEPGANLSHRNLTMAYLIEADLSAFIIYPTDDNPIEYVFADLTGTNLGQADLTHANLAFATLTNANLSQSDLTNAELYGTMLTGTNLTGAEVRGARFYRGVIGGFVDGGTGITLSQLYSTASYQAHQLSGISLYGHNLGGANLADQDLTSAHFGSATLTNANLSQANFTHAFFDSADLTGANLSQANLTNARVIAKLTHADLTGAEVRGATFDRRSYFGAGGMTVAQLYSTASYQAHDLTGINMDGNNLAGVNLAGQNLTNASFANADLTGANLTGAEVRGASFSYFLGITAAQLYSTASYQAHDLTGIRLDSNNLAGVNLVGQNLANAHFYGANLTGANLTGAEVRGASFRGITTDQLYSTASYQAQDLTGIRLYESNFAGANFASQNLTSAILFYSTLTGANLSHANLTHAGFDHADLTDANLSGAEVRGASFYRDNFDGGSGISAAQLYSTASYQVRDLTGIALSSNNLAGVNLVGQNLTNAYFYHATLTGANLTGADVRGAQFLGLPVSAITNNLIQSNGQIAGLDLRSGAALVVRDYDGYPAASPPVGTLPILVEEHLSMDATGTLRLVFDADPWDSTISFAPGIPVALSGTLELAFAPGVDIATQSGRTIDLFDWAGVTPTGVFTVSSPYTWNLTDLYTTGEVTLTAVPSLPGDFNNDGTVDAADYVVWRKTGGTPAAYNTWRANFGQPSGSGSVASANATIPEPTTLVLLMFAAAGWCLRLRRAA